MNMKRTQHLANLEREKILADQYGNSLKKMDQSSKLSELAQSIKDQQNYIDAVFKSSIVEKETMIEQK